MIWQLIPAIIHAVAVGACIGLYFLVVRKDVRAARTVYTLTPTGRQVRRLAFKELVEELEGLAEVSSGTRSYEGVMMALARVQYHVEGRHIMPEPIKAERLEEWATDYKEPPDWCCDDMCEKCAPRWPRGESLARRAGHKPTNPCGPPPTSLNRSKPRASRPDTPPVVRRAWIVPPPNEEPK